MSDNLDFDKLCALYKNDPEKFEEFRKEEIEKFINNSPSHHQQRLRGLQFQVDAKREIHKNAPFRACIEISKMMHESFDSLRYQLNQFTGNKEQLQFQHQYNNNTSAKDEAKVLSFRS